MPSIWYVDAISHTATTATTAMTMMAFVEPQGARRDLAIQGHRDERHHEEYRASGKQKAESVSAWELLQQHQRQLPSFPLLLQPRPSDAGGPPGAPGASPSFEHRTAWLRLPPGVHEVAGEAGAGKSQIALSLSVDLAAGGSNGFGSRSDLPATVYYLSMKSSSKFVDRLGQMVQARGCGPSTLRRIMIREVLNAESLLELLQELLDPTTTANPAKERTAAALGPPRLVVLDSVADLFRGEQTAAPGEGWSTYAALRRIARMLRSYSGRHGSAVLCVNQVSASLATGALKPALGLTWAQEMDRSYMVSRAARPCSPSSSTSGPAHEPAANLTVRTIELRHSSEYPAHRAHFTIQAGGAYHTSGLYP